MLQLRVRKQFSKHNETMTNGHIKQLYNLQVDISMPHSTLRDCTVDTLQSSDSSTSVDKLHTKLMHAACRTHKLTHTARRYHELTHVAHRSHSLTQESELTRHSQVMLNLQCSVVYKGFFLAGRLPKTNWQT